MKKSAQLKFEGRFFQTLGRERMVVFMYSQIMLAAIWPFLITTALIALNEMGDKSQFLAMAFATRMKFRKVMLGIFLAVTFMGSLAVAAGALLASVPGWKGYVSLISAALFLIFGVLTFKPEKDEHDGTGRHRGRGEVAAVFTSFLFAEFGDKTQFVTITLAAQYPKAPLLVLVGSTVGMCIADGLGIFAGIILHKKLPEKFLKFISAALFFFFGLTGMWESLRENFGASNGFAAAAVTVSAAVSLAAAFFIYRKPKA